MASKEEIERAIKATEYKYSGDYEMNDDQRDAVDILVEAAKAHLGQRGDPVAFRVASNSSYPMIYYYSANDPRGPFPANWTETPLYK